MRATLESFYASTMKEFETYILPNGIRGIHRQVRSAVTHCALVVNSGSRDELASEYGIAHLTEHALFKGTERRKAYQVNCRLENLGGELNAYTTKEDTTLHARCCVVIFSVLWNLWQMSYSTRRSPIRS